MVWDEWEQLKSEARSSSSASMHLNGLPAGVGGTSPLPSAATPDFASTPAEKKAAADAIDGPILDATRKAGNWADGSNSAAAKAFGAKDGDGWAAASALKKADKDWGEQVKMLCKRLVSESALLRDTGIRFQSHDIGIGNQLRGVSKLNDIN
ncbi:hypothetical protein ACFV8E_29645 [Streptomyces sp. NPDC059849]|uniref:hypothetical protein n=1 Tax=Streptomyces sp. NPDC059849 TaxID=3346969 RepID=UPI0036605BE5